MHAGLQFSSLQGADLTEADLIQADLSGADLTAANLTGATFSGATLTGGTFTRTSLIPGNVTVTTAGGGATSAPATWGTPTNLPGARFVGCNHNPGDTFPLGATTVTCTILDDSGHAASGTFKVTVVPPTAPSIISTPTNPNLGQPSDVTVEYSAAPNFHVSFTAVAVGNPDPTVQWQVLTSTGWTDVADATSFSFVIDNPPVTDGTQYRAVFTNAGGSVISNPATLTVFPLAIPAQISGGQIFGDSPTFSDSFIGPSGVSVTGSVTCSSVMVPLHPPSSITPTLPVGTYSLAGCTGLASSDPNYAIDYSGSFVVAPAPIVQDSPSANSTTTSDSAAFTDQLHATSPDGPPVVFSQDSGSADLTVSPSGSVQTTGSLTPGPYTATGSMTTSNAVGTWSYTLAVGSTMIDQASPTSASVSVDDLPFTGHLAVASDRWARSLLCKRQARQRSRSLCPEP